MNPDSPPPVYPSAPSATPPPLLPPRRRARGGRIVLILVLVALLVAIGVLCAWFLISAVTGNHPTSLVKMAVKRPYQEAVVGGDESSANKIALIYLTGIITYDPVTDLFGRAASGEPEGMVGEMKSQLRQAASDKSVKAILIRMDTPGGEVTASDDLHHELLRIRQQKPVVVSMASLAASGGYYVAAAADHIVASETTLTGSIGVVISTLTFEETLKKIGVKPVIFKSGKYKDMLSPMRGPSPEEAALLQELVMLDYERFLDVVARGRIRAHNEKHSESDIAAFKEQLRGGLADGRVLIGKQAREGGLVDSLGFFDDAFERAKEIAKVSDARLVQYFRQISFRDLLRFSVQQRNHPLKVELPLLGLAELRLAPGKRYYLHEGYVLP